MTDMTVANTIRDQLGRGTLFMLGAHSLAGDSDTLRFGIKGCRIINKIVIRLEPTDTYTVEFWRVGRKGPVLVSSHDDIYNDGLHDLIKRKTGLETTMPRVIDARTGQRMI